MEVLKDDYDSRALLATMIKDHSVLMNKSMLPSTKIAKEKAWREIKEAFVLNTGKEVTIDQLKKLLYNMKTILKKKTDMKSTGNKAIKLLPWEKDLLSEMSVESNPTFKKVPGCLTAGIKPTVNLNTNPNIHSNEYDEDHNSDNNETPCMSTSSNSVLNSLQGNKTINRKRKLAEETEETAKLTTSELQRLLLLDQIKLTKIQIEKETILLNKEKNLFFNVQDNTTQYIVIGNDEMNSK